MKDLMAEMNVEEEGPMDDQDMRNKLEVLKELHEMATQLLSNDMESSEEYEDDDDYEDIDEIADIDDIMDMGDVEKVSVMAEDEEGLEEGLDKAQDILKKKDKKSKRPF